MTSASRSQLRLLSAAVCAISLSSVAPTQADDIAKFTAACNPGRLRILPARCFMNLRSPAEEKIQRRQGGPVIPACFKRESRGHRNRPPIETFGGDVLRTVLPY